MTRSEMTKRLAVDPGVSPPGGSRLNPSLTRDQENTMMPEPANTSPVRIDDALRLDGAVNLVDLARHDLNVVLRELPTDAPLFAVVDVVTALGHLKQAAVLVDKAADAIEAVQR